MERRVIAIVGCTASGKGAVSRELARRWGAEIISVDSMKVYRGMDVGTAKPGVDVRGEIPHHLIDVADPWEPFSAARFVELADPAIEAAHERGRPVVAVGGTVMYFKFLYEGLFAGPAADERVRAELRARAAREGLAALHGELAEVDPEAAGRIHPNDLRRIERALEVYRLTGRPISALQQQWERETVRRGDWQWVTVGLRRAREEGNRRINARVRRMVEAGLIGEARRIWEDRRGFSEQAGQAVGYAELFAHFRGELSEAEAIERIKINSRRLAKSQRTWLKRMRYLQWVEVGTEDEVGEVADRVAGVVEDGAGQR